MAWLSEWLGKRKERIAGWIASSTPLPVVLLSLTVLVIAASQIQQVLGYAGQLTHVALLFVVYLFLAAVIGRLTVRLYRLSTKAGRGVIFSASTLPWGMEVDRGWTGLHRPAAAPACAQSTC